MDPVEAGAAMSRCLQEFGTLLTIANVTLWVGLIVAILIALLTVLERFAALKKVPAMHEAGGSVGVATYLDSLKGLIAALTAAPPWFAIFLAGVLLLWCSEKFSPDGCYRHFASSGHAAAAEPAKTDDAPHQ